DAVLAGEVDLGADLGLEVGGGDAGRRGARVDGFLDVVHGQSVSRSMISANALFCWRIRFTVPSRRPWSSERAGFSTGVGPLLSALGSGSLSAGPKREHSWSSSISWVESSDWSWS